MSQRRRTIALVGSNRGEVSASVLAAHCAHLAEHGWDPHLFRDDEGPVRPRFLGRRVRTHDLVHFDSARAAAAPPAWIGSPGACVVTIGSCDLYTADSRDRQEEQVLEGCRRADLIHLPDEALWEPALKLGCPPSTPRAIVHPAADPALLGLDRNDSAQSGKLRMVSVGPVTWMAGFEHALHAVRMLLDRGIDCRYRLLGAGPHDNTIFYNRDELGLTGTVELVEDADHARCLAELGSADLYLHSAVVPGINQGVVDGLAASLPIVASDAGATLKDVLGAGAGVTVPRRDPGAIAEAIEMLAADSHARLEMGRRAREIAIDRFDFGAQMDAFERLYAEVVSASDGFSRKSAPKV